MLKLGLSRYFQGVAAKRLTAVEVDSERSNQHEFQGVAELRRVLGDAPRKGTSAFDARFLFLDDDDLPVVARGSLSWYNARENKPRAPEWHAYYSGKVDVVVTCARAGDLAFIGLRPDGSVTVVFARAGTAMERRLCWLFGFPDTLSLLQVADVPTESELTPAQDMVIEQLGLEPDREVNEQTELALLIEEFKDRFPTTMRFSSFARYYSEMKALADPDRTIVGWFETEERLFRVFERYLLQRQLVSLLKLADAKKPDVDAFMDLAMSAMQRRKARAGRALENHLEAVFREHTVRYSRTAQTELKKTPDFVFPGKTEYHDASFPSQRLTMLGVKTTGKDRWRQVINEADRIDLKHYFTLETAISEAQTAEMQSEQLQLVVPQPLHVTFTAKQREWIWPLSEFLHLVKGRQRGQ